MSAPLEQSDFWHEPWARCQSGRRVGTIVTEVYGGYVTVRWDSGRTEQMVHIGSLKRVTE
jgi:hypothetical protein